MQTHELRHINSSLFATCVIIKKHKTVLKHKMQPTNLNIINSFHFKHNNKILERCELLNISFNVERICQHNQLSHGLCDDNGQCPDPGHQCYTTDDDRRVCCNKNLPTPVCILFSCNTLKNVVMSEKI